MKPKTMKGKTKKFLVTKIRDGMRLLQLSERPEEILRMEIILRDGDIVETGHGPYPIITIEKKMKPKTTDGEKVN